MSKRQQAAVRLLQAFAAIMAVALIFGGPRVLVHVEDGMHAQASAGQPAPVLHPAFDVVLAPLEQFNAYSAIEYDRQVPMEVGPHFGAHFMRKNEDPRPLAVLHVSEIDTDTLDTPVVEVLGDKSVISLGQLYSVLKLQAHGESGPLYANGWANVAYIRDQNGTLSTVDAGWVDGHWYVESFPIDAHGPWKGGARFIHL